MNAEIISVGTELLLGDIINTNAYFLAQKCAEFGLTVHYQTVVGDNVERLSNVVKEAKDRSDILIFTGGLGPTADDLTKETVAAVFEDELVEDEEEVEKLQSFFKASGRGTITENNFKQAYVPVRGSKLENYNGTAPGMMFTLDEKYAFLLPGPPSEMKPMFLRAVVPYLQQWQDSTLYSHVLKLVGIGESSLETMVEDLLEKENPTAALYAKTGEVHIRITAKAEKQKLAQEMCEETAEIFRARVGSYIYTESEENLESTVVRLLKENKYTVASAESCTGGLLSTRITSVPGSSEVFNFGACTYANAAKVSLLGVSEESIEQRGVVSAQVALEMARGILSIANADYGVGITGIAGPDGGTEEKPVGLVYIAIAGKKEAYVRRMMWPNHTRDAIREFATQNALDMVRRCVLQLSIPDAERFYKEI